jgi:hypothetical protein
VCYAWSVTDKCLLLAVTPPDASSEWLIGFLLRRGFFL